MQLVFKFVFKLISHEEYSLISKLSVLRAVGYADAAILPGSKHRKLQWARQNPTISTNPGWHSAALSVILQIANTIANNRF